MALLKAKLIDGTVVEFDDQPIGAGGEKVVFFTKDKQSVVCFFYSSLTDRPERRRRLEKIMGGYNPTTGNNGDYWKTHFCWPTGIIDGEALPKVWLHRNNILDPPLAVVAPAYRKNFFFTNTLGRSVEKNGKWFTSERPRKLLPPDEKGNFLGYLQVCTKMARAVARMHLAGLAHSDLSNKNVLIDPKGGDACIIDIDSLVVPGFAPPSVDGTPGYIAPEVLGRKGAPNIQTDLHAMAVLIYETLLLRHPLKGPKVNSKTSPEEDERLSLGEKALFIEHPSDRSNYPKPIPPLSYSILGPYLSELMQRAFVDGLHQPGKRPTAPDWERALYRTFDLLHPSPGIAGEWFVIDPTKPLQCPYSKKKLTSPVPFARFYSENKPGNFVHEKHSLFVWHNMFLMKWHTTARSSPGPTADRTPQGYFSFHQGRWWLVITADAPAQIVNGQTVSRNQPVEIIPNLQLRFTHTNGRLLAFDYLQP